MLAPLAAKHDGLITYGSNIFSSIQSLAADLAGPPASKHKISQATDTIAETHGEMIIRAVQIHGTVNER